MTANSELDNKRSQRKEGLPVWMEFIVMGAALLGCIGFSYALVGYYRLGHYVRWDLVFFLIVGGIFIRATLRRIRFKQKPNQPSEPTAPSGRGSS